MRPGDTDDSIYDVDEGGDDVFAEADQLYQRAYDEVYPDVGEEDYAALEDAGARRAWWRTRQGRVFGFVAGVIGVVILLLLVRSAELSNSGVIRITATPAAPTAAAVEASAWPAAVEFVPHTLPAMIKNEIAAAGQQQGYRFDGEVGDTWTITVEAQSDTLDPLATLYAPSGAVVASSDDRSQFDLTSEMQVTLPESGAYGLVVESSAGGVTVGPYLLTVFAG